MLAFFKHELKSSWKSVLLWSVLLSMFAIFCVSIYPEMKNSMDDEMEKIYSSLGSLSAAFGLDKLKISDLLNFYGIECGVMIGIGGAMFAAMAGISALSKEESAHTAEFLFTHPVSRSNINLQKLLALVVKIMVFNLFIFAVGAVAIYKVDSSVDMAKFTLFHTALAIMMLQIGVLTMGILTWLRRNNIGLGIGLATGFYFLSLVINLKKEMDFLRFVTPFYYADASRVLVDNKIDWSVIGVQWVVAVLVLIVGLVYYSRRDLSN